jgi:hypothetical protein
MRYSFGAVGGISLNKTAYGYRQKQAKSVKALIKTPELGYRTE